MIFQLAAVLMPQKRNPDSLELVRGLSPNLCAHSNRCHDDHKRH
ncbi:hypothetical protein DOY81_011301, partial [Sarcophaga bullata]